MPTSLKRTVYTAEASAIGGREGHVESDDGVLEHSLSLPEGLGGPGGSGTNPEQLFAAGYAACFQGALGLASQELDLDITDSIVTAKVHIGKVDGGGFGLAVDLTGRFPNATDDEAEQLMEKAHALCPYSRATRGNIDVSVAVAT